MSITSGGLGIGYSDPGTGNLRISGYGSVGSYLTVAGEIRQGGSDYGAYEIQTTGQLYVNDYGIFMGGVHVGGTADPGADNLRVDGNTLLQGDLQVYRGAAWRSSKVVVYKDWATLGSTYDLGTSYATIVSGAITVPAGCTLMIWANVYASSVSGERVDCAFRLYNGATELTGTAKTFMYAAFNTLTLIHHQYYSTTWSGTVYLQGYKFGGDTTATIRCYNYNTRLMWMVLG